MLWLVAIAPLISYSLSRGTACELRPRCGTACELCPRCGTHRAMASDSERATVEAMRIKQIKEELTSLGVAHDDAFEKSDLVDRLVNARGDSASATNQQAAGSSALPDLGDGKAPSIAESEQGAQILMDDPEGPALMKEIEKNPKLKQAMIDLALQGDSAMARYEDDEEVCEFLQRLQQVAARGGAAAEGL